MNPTILTADGGSTKTMWRLTDAVGHTYMLKTQGIHPGLMDESSIKSLICTELLPQIPGEMPIDIIRYFGAGCRDTACERMEHVLHSIWPGANSVTVGSDIVGAAEALFGEDGEGIACILGTGSNSCHYCRGIIVDNVPPMGYILGDEGSGAVLGRRLLGDVYKGLLPSELTACFADEVGLTAEEAIERTYRGTLPNRFLASLVPFIARHRDQYPSLQQLVMEEFVRFFHRNVAHYGRRDLEVGLVGGVAATFANELHLVAKDEGYCLGRILRSPLEG